MIEEHERSIISGVVRLADRPVREVMTPRTEVDWLDIGLDEAGIREKLVDSPHTRLPVAEGSVDAVVGVVQARDIVAAAIRGDRSTCKVLMRAGAGGDRPARRDGRAGARCAAPKCRWR